MEQIHEVHKRNPYNIPNYTVRDFQRTQVYSAEERCSFWKEPHWLDPQEVIQTVQAISNWADISEPRSFLKKSSEMGVPVPSAIAFATPDIIFLPAFAWNQSYVCHEMAHVISYQKGPNDHHGPNFVKTYLNIVNFFIGPTECDELLTELSKNQVQCGVDNDLGM